MSPTSSVDHVALFAGPVTQGATTDVWFTVMVHEKILVT